MGTVKAADLFPFRGEVRQGTLLAVRSLPKEHLEWKPTGGVHSIADWLRHIAQREDWWIQAVVLGQERFTLRRNAKLAELPEMLTYLEDTRAATERLLLEWPAETLRELREVATRGGWTGSRRQVSLHWIMAHQFDHERHHRAQIYLYLRLMGLEPPAS